MEEKGCMQDYMNWVIIIIIIILKERLQCAGQ